ncbi:hypothetical protein BLNAU_24057 [Blattamonas nauphoetae]|uniref:Uncharacterized protein n=1 Tax=Blattamonas nauphoetae TaxID=2049346 RepID=A0ABQ9WNY7_9EUKA|nr:hypothetical protein BLNAU_24057 [Blattamonas nauphoetae]
MNPILIDSLSDQPARHNGIVEGNSSFDSSDRMHQIARSLPPLIFIEIIPFLLNNCRSVLFDVSVRNPLTLVGCSLDDFRGGSFTLRYCAYSNIHSDVNGSVLHAINTTVSFTHVSFTNCSSKNCSATETDYDGNLIGKGEQGG